MALINCPECNYELSEYALNCPKCGCPIEVIKKIIKLKKEEELIRLEEEKRRVEKLKEKEEKKAKENEIIKARNFEEKKNFYLSNIGDILIRNEQTQKVRVWKKDDIEINETNETMYLHSNFKDINHTLMIFKNHEDSMYLTSKLKISGRYGDHEFYGEKIDSLARIVLSNLNIKTNKEIRYIEHLSKKEKSRRELVRQELLKQGKIINWNNINKPIFVPFSEKKISIYTAYNNRDFWKWINDNYYISPEIEDYVRNAKDYDFDYMKYVCRFPKKSGYNFSNKDIEEICQEGQIGIKNNDIIFSSNLINIQIDYELPYNLYFADKIVISEKEEFYRCLQLFKSDSLSFEEITNCYERNISIFCRNHKKDRISFLKSYESHGKKDYTLKINSIFTEVDISIEDELKKLPFYKVFVFFPDYLYQLSEKCWVKRKCTDYLMNNLDMFKDDKIDNYITLLWEVNNRNRSNICNILLNFDNPRSILKINMEENSIKISNAIHNIKMEIKFSKNKYIIFDIGEDRASYACPEIMCQNLLAVIKLFNPNMYNEINIFFNSPEGISRRKKYTYDNDPHSGYYQSIDHKSICYVDKNGFFVSPKVRNN